MEVPQQLAWPADSGVVTHLIAVVSCYSIICICISYFGVSMQSINMLFPSEIFLVIFPWTVH